jgi:protein-disulfide isomerase
MIPLAIVVAAIIAAGAYFLMQGNVTEVQVTQVETPEQPDNAAAASSAIEDMVLGDANAPITMIEYASYTCPHCGSFHQNTYPQLKADYIDTGKVKFIFREVYFDRFGLWASMIARCGGQERFFGITDLMFKTQADWTRAGEPVAIADELRKIGRLAGLNDEELNSCLQNEESAKTLVEWFQANAARDEINSTPSFLINGTKYGNMSYSEMKSLLDGML